jgi:hypothetical protein
MLGVLVSMVVGAFVGDWMIGHAHPYAPLVPVVVIAFVSIVGWVALKQEPPAAQPVTAQPAPALPAPALPAPAQPVPAQPVPAQPVPAQPVPAQPVPAQRAARATNGQAPKEQPAC